MEFYIRIQNKRPLDHPISKENMETAFPEFDLNNLPEGWAKFIKVAAPKIGPYEVSECVYEWDDELEVVKEVWYTHQMSDEEKLQKQERVKKTWKDDNGPSNWIFDEERCVHVPPIPMPDDGKNYIWVQAANNWVEVILEPVIEHNRPPYPTDGKIYLYDEDTNTWVNSE